MRINVLLIMCALAGVANAQVPGYMGKRFTVFLDGNIAPAMFVQNENNALLTSIGSEDRPHKSGIAFNYRPQVTAEYLVGRKISLGVSYSLLKMGTVRAFQTGEETDENQWSTDYDVVKGTAAGFHIKLYSGSRSGAVAPLGFYHAFSVYLTKTNTYDDKRSSVKQFRDDFSYPVATYGWGKQTMFARNFIIKTGVELGWAFVPSNYITQDDYDWNVQEYSGYNVHGSLMGYYLINVSIAIGYIPF